MEVCGHSEAALRAPPGATEADGLSPLLCLISHPNVYLSFSLVQKGSIPFLNFKNIQRWN